MHRQAHHRYLDHQIIHNHIVKGAAKQGFQLSAAFDLADNGTQGQAVPKGELGPPATIQGEPWSDLSLHIACTKSANRHLLQLISCSHSFLCLRPSRMCHIHIASDGHMHSVLVSYDAVKRPNSRLCLCISFKFFQYKPNKSSSWHAKRPKTFTKLISPDGDALLHRTNFHLPTVQKNRCI